MRAGLRAVCVVGIFFLGVFLLYLLRYSYDQGDLKKAARFLHEAKPHGYDKTFVGLMAENLSVTPDEVICAGELLSRYAGLIRLTCQAKTGAVPPDQDKTFALELEIVGFAYKPLNEDAKALFGGS